MKPKKILMASLVPFWYRQTGAQQRIFALVEALQTGQHQVKTFFPMPGFTCDQELIKKYALDVEQHTSDMLPSGVMPKAKWYVRAVANQLKTVAAGLPSISNKTSGLTLEDYKWPWAQVAFEQTVKRYQPDIIICQYVTTAWLLEGITDSQRHEIHCIIDTHDLLSNRNEQFEQRGHGHWIKISAEEESKVLARFDTVIAIQRREADLMQSMAPATRTVVVGHHAGDSQIVQRKRAGSSASQRFALGYIASVNASNVDAIERFLEEIWSPIAESRAVELVVAGAICDTIAPRVDQLNAQTRGTVRLLGKLDEVIDFYMEIDVAINPVRFGTGLKIKTVEALSHGVPVLTTEPQLPCNDDTSPAAVVYCESLAVLADEIERLQADGRHLELLKSAAIEAAERSGQAVYQELLEVIAEP